jgi:CHAT domain-containing protein/tetratricopeptide (TPR) repeat protein
LTRPFDKHLDSEEMDAFLSLQRASVSDLGQISEQSLREARRHLESCQVCSETLQMHQFVQSEISRMRGPDPSPPTPDCSERAEWLEIAAGLRPAAETRELMKHAAQCGHCGPLLKIAAEALVDEVTPGEEAWLASLPSARPEWRKKMAEKLRRSSAHPDNACAKDIREGKQRSRWWPALFSWPRPALVFGCVAAVILAGWIGARFLRSSSVEQLLAQAYTEHRTLEVRIPGAKYAPMRVERGAGNSNLDKSPALLHAEDLIGENLRQHPNDPTWLQARARADLLDGNYDSAIKSLQRALETAPDSASLLTDLGSAYFLRAESADRPIDYGNAIESLSKALTKSPDDPVALFNRALAGERLFLYTEAVDDWRHYLRVDPQGDWSNDARARLAALQGKIKQHEKSQNEPLLTPEEIAKAGPDDAGVREKIEKRVEEYLRVAITDWLLEAFPIRAGQPSAEARAALVELSDITQKNHSDNWLKDLLGGSAGAQFPSGLEALSASLRSNDTGDYSAARTHAHRAAQLFRAAANPAGELRAQAEEVYSNHLLMEGSECLVLLRSMRQRYENLGFGWIAAQMSLEESNCSSEVGDLETYRVAIERGLRKAGAHKYESMHLRALGFQALSSASVGDYSSCFSLMSEGFKLFWGGTGDSMKGYNMYFNLESSAEVLRLPNLQVALLREATYVIDANPNLLRRAMAHSWYGKAAYQANLTELAAAQFAQASSLFAASPQSEATKRDKMDAQVYLANAELRQGDVEQATQLLEVIKPTLDSTPTFDAEIGFYSVAADLAMLRADPAATESSLRSAIYLSEWALQSYRSETNRREWAEETRNAYRDVVEWRLRQGDAASALELWEWYRGADLRSKDSLSAKFGSNNPPDPNNAPPLPTPTVVANRLPLLRDETVVAYGAFPDGIAVWAYDDRGVFSRWIPTSLAAVQERVLRFERLCSDPTSDVTALRTVGHSLYDLLVAPVAGRLLPERAIVFEPDDIFAAMPWGALVGPASRYLAEQTPIVVAPGLYRQMRLRQSPPMTPESTALLVSVPAVPQEGLAPLVDADSEVQTAAAAFPSAHRLQGVNATISAIRKEMHGVQLFHFAGHALALPQRSGLVLAELDPRSQLPRLIGADSFTPNETSALRLAVLSACHSGAEKQIDSGTESLVESFLRAGVPHVVATKWSVDSLEASELMKVFYTSLLAGSDVADAMHIAQLALASRPASAHPFYWAAFELQGIR